MGEVPLTAVQKKLLAKLPCDGKPRFTVKEFNGRQTYSDAYDLILGPTKVWTIDSLRRVKALNRLYLMYAKDFVECQNFRAGVKP